MESPASRISHVECYTTDLPLIKPYDLSFVTLDSFVSNFFRIEFDDGSSGLGEATALPGYGDETSDAIGRVHDAVKDELVGLTAAVAREKVVDVYSDSPFAASAIGSALDMASGSYKLPDEVSVPLVYPVSAYADKKDLQLEVENAFAVGYRTVKVKVGKDVKTDVSVMKYLQSLSFDMMYRYDANQGYDLDDACCFMDAAVSDPSGKFDYLEQPLERFAWDLDERLNEKYPGGILLDESIYDEGDIERAAGIGCKYVKLKLFKTMGLTHLVNVSRSAVDAGMSVVLGNGVSTDVCNASEVMVYCENRSLFHGAFEGNGCVKMVKPAVYDVVRVENGNMLFN